MNAYIRLRSATAAAVPVSMESMRAYVEMLGCAVARDVFVELMQRLDAQWLKNRD